MFLTKKKIIALVLAALVLLLAMISVFLIYFKANTIDNTPDEIADNLTGATLPSGKDLGGPTDENNTDKPEQPRKPSAETRPLSEAEQAENLARYFVEALGSYSSDANFENIFLLRGTMTDKMSLWSDDFIKRNRDNLLYEKERMTTKVYNIESLGYSEKRAVFLLNTRRERESVAGSSVYNQDAVATIIKEGGQWKVDAVEWR